MLGPVRFNHIEACASEVCKNFRNYEAVEDIIPQLRALDDQVVELRMQLAALKQQQASVQSENPTSAKATNYASLLEPLDLAKAQRLLKARQGSVKSLTNLIARSQ